MMRLYVPKLLQAAGKSVRAGQYGRAYLLLDAAMEHLIPPFSVMAALSGLFLAVSLPLPVLWRIMGTETAVWAANLARINLYLAVALIVGQLIYLLSGLRLVHAPKNVYMALLNIPVFVTWKVWHYGRVLLGFDSHGWIRTAARNDEG